MLSFLHSPTLTSIHDLWKTIALTRRTFVGKVMSLLFNMLSRLVITFLPRNKRLLISWLQSPSVVMLLNESSVKDILEHRCLVSINILFSVSVFCCHCSVTRFCPTLCDLMDCSMPGFPVGQYLLEFAQTHVHCVSDAIQPPYLLSPPSLPALNLSQHQDLFQ